MPDEVLAANAEVEVYRADMRQARSGPASTGQQAYPSARCNAGEILREEKAGA